MSKNLLLCALGIVAGFTIGFFITNAVTRPSAVAAPTRAGGGGDARPLRPEQMGEQLPPGHPDLSGGESAAGGAPAANSAEAQSAMEKADRSPKDFAAQTEAARVFYGLHDYQKAALYLERALKLKGDDYDALVLMGNTKYDAKEFDAAAGFYERALRINPKSPDVRTDFGNTFFNRGDLERAIAEYRKSVAIDPDHLNSWRNIAAASLRKGDKATANEAVEQLARIAPRSPDAEAFRREIERLP